MARIADIKTIKLPVIHDSRGNLSYVENSKHIPFDIKRVFYLFDIPSTSVREGHAHKKLHQVIFALSGSFEITLNDGYDIQKIQLNKPYVGLYLPNMIWRDISNFSSGAVCMVLASHEYDPTDYLRSFDEYVDIVNPPTSITF